MAKRKKRRTSRAKQSQYPPIVWMLFGLAIGLSVAFAVYIKDREPAVVARSETPRPASLQNSIDENIDNNGEAVAAANPVEKADNKRFTFYDILPNVDIQTPDNRPEVRADVAPTAIVEPGVYVLQAGSFSTYKDADRRRAELALHGIESHVRKVTINDRNYNRVYVGPTDDLDELNMLRSRLRAAKIDVFRIRLSD